MALLGLLVLGGAGCIEIEEDVLVKHDGSVDYTFDYGMPEFVVVMITTSFGGGTPDSGAAFLTDRPPVTVVDGDSTWTSEYVRGDLRHFKSRRAMASLDRLVTEGSRPDSMKDWIAPVLEGFDVERLGRDRIRLRRLVFPRRSQADLREKYGQGRLGSPEEFEKPELQRRILAGRTYRLTVRAPRILSTNGALSEDRTTATWSYPMSETVSDTVMALEAVLELR